MTILDEKRNNLLPLAEKIIAYFQTKMVKDLPYYMQGWRAKKVLEAIEDLKSGNLKPDYNFDHQAGMCSDELDDHAEVASDLTNLKWDMVMLYKEMMKEEQK